MKSRSRRLDLIPVPTSWWTFLFTLTCICGLFGGVDAFCAESGGDGAGPAESVSPGETGTAVTLAGRLEMVFIDDFERQRADVRHLLITDCGTRCRVVFTDDPELLPGTRLEITGQLSGGLLRATSWARLGPAAGPNAPGPATDRTRAGNRGYPNLGEQRLVVLLVNSFENPVETATIAEIEERVFDEANTFSITNYIQEVSYEKAWVTGEVHGWFTLPLTEDQLCNDYEILIEETIAAADPEVYFPDFFRLFVIFPEAGCNWWGGAISGLIPIQTDDGIVNMSYCQINSVAHLGGTEEREGTGVHELGHNFGCLHANDWECGDDVIDGDCYTVNYGDCFDVMGRSAGRCHYNARHKEDIGWLEPEQILVTTEPGVYLIEPLETATGGLKALRIPRDGGQSYYVEYRRPIGFDAFLPEEYDVNYDGAMIHYRRPGGTGDTQLLDMSPHSGDSTSQFYDSLDTALGQGQVFYEPYNRLTITTLGFDEESLVVEIRDDEPFLVTGPGPDAANPPLVRVFPAAQDASHDLEFSAYGVAQFGVNVACGDVDGDRLDEIITGAGPGAVFGPHVRGFALDGTPLPGLSFFAYGTAKWGVNVAAGDLDGDGRDEIITGAGPGAVFGPHVRAFGYDGAHAVTPLPGVSFFAYGTPKWGVNVAAGDLDGDGRDEIITGAGPGAVYGPHVRGFGYDGMLTITPLPGVSFFAYGTPRFGVNVSCGDLDGDGIDELVTGSGPGACFSAHVRGWTYDGQAISSLPGINFLAWPSNQARYGARIFAGADLDHNGRDDIVVGGGPDPARGTEVAVFSCRDLSSELLLSLQAYPEGWRRGVTVAGGKR